MIQKTQKKKEMTRPKVIKKIEEKRTEDIICSTKAGAKLQRGFIKKSLW